MPLPVIMPKLEMSQETARIIEWLKKEGDPVTKGEPLLAIETDKLTVEVESPGAGRLAGIQRGVGEIVPVTTVIAYLLQAGETLTPKEIGPIAGNQIIESPGDKGRIFPATPLARRIAAEKGIDLSRVNGSGRSGKVTRRDLASLLGGESVPKVALLGETISDAAEARRNPRASPAARRMAREQGLQIVEIEGTGPRGRVQVRDVSARIADGERMDLEEVIPLRGMRRTIAERVLASYQGVPHIYLTARADVTALEDARKTANQLAATRGEKHISLTALLVKILAWSLGQHPWLNSSLRGDGIHLYKTVNLGIAVALPDGLIVPVIRAADRKEVEQIVEDVEDKVRRAREGRLVPEDIAGGTFTLSNLGPFGVESFTAILNPGQTGILAVGAVQPEPVAMGERVEIRPIMHMTLAVDHRVVDGAVAAQFMATLKQAIENPALSL